MMHNPKRLCLCYFLTLAHSVSVILSLYMTREELERKAAMSYPFFHFLTVIIFSECGWLLQERNTNKEELDRMARQFVFFRLPFFFTFESNSVI